MKIKKNILVVEDERIVARDLQRSLTDLGYEVPSTAASGDEAIRVATERCPDLVMMDIRIKGERDGIDTALLLRSRFGVPVVYLTAYADVPTVERAKATQPYGYLLKPFRTQELRSVVEIALYKHQQEQYLLQRERQSMATLRCMGDAVIACDAEGKITFMNPVAEQLTGWDPQQVLGFASGEVMELFNVRDTKPLENPLETALRQNRVVRMDGLLHNKDGDLLIGDSAAPMVDEKGKVLGAVMIFRDRTEEHRRQLAAETNARMESTGTMAAGVGHEINNPLAAVMSNLEMALKILGNSTADPEVVDCLKNARAGADRIRRLVANLQAYSRPTKMDKEKLNLAELLRSQIKDYGPLGSLGKLVTDIGDLPLVTGDRARLAQVFGNLLSNAVLALPPESGASNRLKVTARTGTLGEAVIEISDNGYGMQEEVLRRAFEPFFTTRAPRGSGLGLSVCHGIAGALGGKIELESQLGVGTVARLILPPAGPETAEPPEKKFPSTSKTIRGQILVVDDDPMVRNVMRKVLEREHSVHLPETPEQALALIQGGMEFDLILCDLLMPGLSGMDLHGRLLESHPDQSRRMVFVTGGAFVPEAMEFLERIPNARLEKPFALPQLRQLLQEQLQRLGLVERKTVAP